MDRERVAMEISVRERSIDVEISAKPFAPGPGVEQTFLQSEAADGVVPTTSVRV